jgi:hypothetical protein
MRDAGNNSSRPADNFEDLSRLGESIWSEIRDRGGLDPNTQSYLRETINRLVFEYYTQQNLDYEKIRHSVMKQLDSGIV